ncbi:YqeB family protein [Streptomyces iconiensis]|uniref:Uncharacterized protein n=1 Tax=Streptomyces iconiensis TaxID=1384038 RepID=A0ABT6ZQV7_9ACTN|nr:hypothetical protein [Streptomyces iconiensis]MDJ1131450.1 hypothetical protein [Streptomyces iconiensis]
MRNEGNPNEGNVYVDKSSASEPAETRIGPSVWLVPAFAAVGAALGWGAELLAGWLVTLPWAPLQKPAELVNSVPDPWRTLGLVVIGLAAGVVVGLLALHEELSLRLTDDRLTLTAEGEEREFAGSRVALAFQDGKRLVLLDAEGRELARERCDVSAARLAEAFTRHGYSWAEQDPHKDEFRRWVPETPGLPEGANALLKARAHALKQSGGAKDRRELREELARIGVYVRDEDKRQFVRTR